MIRVFLAAFIAVFLAAGAHAAPGDLDTTFGGGNGWVSTGFLGQSSNNGANSAVQQADGKLVVAGYSDTGNSTDFTLLRYNADGTLDDAFGTDGKVITAIGSEFDVANSVIQQVDGKLVAAGYARAGSGASQDFALVRYNANGTLDAGFGNSGKVTTAIGTSNDVAYSVIQQADGKLVAAGSGYILNGSGYEYQNFVLVRYNANGTLDTGFGTGGKVTTVVGSRNQTAYSLIQQADGKLVAAGYADASPWRDFALVRYNADGSLDTSFGTDGKVTTAIGTINDEAYSVIQQADGKLVAAGYSNNDFALVRYNLDGSLDTSFGTGGKVTTNFTGSSYDQVYSVIQQADGKLAAAGYSDSGNDNFALVRYNTDGSLDTSFGTGGKVTTPISSEDDTAKWVLQQADGKLVAVGNNTTNSSGWRDVVLVRYNLDGALDATFNTSGKVIVDSFISSDESYSVIQQADGKLVAAGFAITGNFNYDFALVRYNPDGTLDAGFGAGGKITTDIGAVNDRAYSVIQQADGKLVVAGSSDIGSYSWYSDDEFVLVRYNTDGTLDTSFGTGGKVITAFVGSSDDFAQSVIQQADGKLVAAGHSRNDGDGNEDFALVRYNTDGSLDTSFGTGGKVTTGINNNDQAYSLIQQADGKLVVAGASSRGSNDDFALVRYNSNGTLDSRFGTGGKIVTSLGNDADQLNSLIQQSDGKLVAAGSKSNGYSYAGEFVLVRYNMDGTLDTGFGTGGKAATVISPYGGSAKSVIQQVDGKLVAAGIRSTYGDFTLVRFNTNGTLDAGFGAGGNVMTAIGGVNNGSEQATALIQQMDGKLTVAGYSSGMPTGKEFVIARYESGLLDSDNDGLFDAIDACPFDATASSGNNDGDTLCDLNDTDDDNDGLLDGADNCPLNADPEQLDTDADAEGDVCDTDDDNDGVEDVSDEFPLDATQSGDPDGDGIDSNDDLDDDTDGVPDTNDAFPFDSSEWADADSDGAGDNAEYDDDNDGVDDDLDNCPVAANADQINTDGDAQGDACDAAPDDKETAVKITAGDQHACTITNTGGVQCWGNNDYGQLGNNSYSYAYKPVAVRGLSSGITAITTGNYHTCALNSGGGVVCWGNNDYGQLGSYGYANVPKAVSGLSTGVVAISAGAYHTCALTNGGAVLCWGEYSSTPVAVSGLGGGVIAIAAGGYHDCALMSSGGAMCWGYNGSGQLGDNSTVDQPAPVAVSGLGSGVVVIEAGVNHSCAVMGGGEMKCWGYNGDGELGDSSNVDQLVPVAVTGLSIVQAAATGLAHSCALISAGAVDCWGANLAGQLGDGSGSDQYAPVAVSGLDKAVVAIAAGSYHSCAVTNEGGILCWGANWSGQLGDNSGSDQYVPVWVSGFEGVDSDGDGVVLDNCPSTANSDQLNTDGDTSGDACDGDDDSDGVLDASDAFPLNSAEWLDTDSDGTGNNADMDDDNDGIPDYIDADPLNTAIHTEKILPLNGQYKGSALKETVIKQ